MPSPHFCSGGKGSRSCSVLPNGRALPMFHVHTPNVSWMRLSPRPAAGVGVDVGQRHEPPRLLSDERALERSLGVG
eukprot:4602517-Prymnesium_polylepis.1